MAKTLCVVLRKAPYGTIHAAEALRHINGGIAHGLKTTAIFIDDGVFTAKADQTAAEFGWTSLSETLQMTLRFSTTLPDGSPNRAQVWVHAPSLEARGLAPKDLMAGVKPINDEEMASLLAEAHAVLLY